MIVGKAILIAGQNVFKGAQSAVVWAFTCYCWSAGRRGAKAGITLFTTGELDPGEEIHTA